MTTRIDLARQEQFERSIGLLPIMELPLSSDPEAEYLMRSPYGEGYRVWVGFIEALPDRGTRRYLDTYGNWREIDSLSCMTHKAMSMNDLEKLLTARLEDDNASSYDEPRTASA